VQGPPAVPSNIFLNHNNDDDGSNSAEKSLNFDYNKHNKLKKSNDSDYVDENFDIDDD
jgi:hypothetical protein